MQWPSARRRRAAGCACPYLAARKVYSHWRPESTTPSAWRIEDKVCIILSDIQILYRHLQAFALPPTFFLNLQFLPKALKASPPGSGSHQPPIDGHVCAFRVLKTRGAQYEPNRLSIRAENDTNRWLLWASLKCPGRSKILKHDFHWFREGRASREIGKAGPFSKPV